MKKTLLIGVLLLVGLYGCNPWFERTDDEDDEDSNVTSIKPALLEYSTELSFYFKCFVSFSTGKKECQLFYRPDLPTYSLSYSWLPLQVKNFEDSTWRSILYYATGDSGANDKSDYGQYEFLTDDKLVLHFYNTGEKFVKRDTMIQCNHGLPADSLGVVHFVIRDYKKSEMEVSVDVSRYRDALPEVTDSGAVFTKDSLCDYVVYDSLCIWKYTIFQTLNAPPQFLERTETIQKCPSKYSLARLKNFATMDFSGKDTLAVDTWDFVLLKLNLDSEVGVYEMEK